jgi:AraC-like DNA-binding protein
MQKATIKYFKSNQYPLKIVCGRGVSGQFPMHRHLTISLGVVLSGSRQLVIHSNKLIIACNDIFIINANEPHTIEKTNDLGHDYLIVSMDVKWLLRQMETENVRFKNLVENEELLHILTILFNDLILGNNQLNEDLLVEQLAENLKKCIEPTKSIRYLDERLKRASELLDSKFPENLQLNAIASHSFLSPFHFARLFKKQTGLAPHQYLLDNRLRYARQLLEERLPIADIAIISGFYDSSHFVRHFSKFYGVSPLEYQKGILPLV